MTKDEAIAIAIEAIDERANETYEGSELQEPEVIKWIQEQKNAIVELRKL